MRADRLLSMLLMLQARGRMTAQDIAEELEVSERTVYRDIDALCIAGIPICTQSGTNGGVFLDEHYRVTLHGLSKDQVLSLFASKEAGPLADIGMARAAKDSLLNLFNTLPAPHQQEVERMRQRFHIDPAGWFSVGEDAEMLRLLQDAVWGDYQIEMTYHAIGYDPRILTVDAYALVSKADKWYLIGRKANGEYRTYRLTRIHDLHLLQIQFQRDPAFDLVEYWQSSRQQFYAQMSDIYPQYFATLRVHTEMFWYVASFFEGRFQQIGESEGWLTIEVEFSNAGEARTHVMAMGTQVEIIAPEALRDEVLAQAQALIAHYAPETQP